MQKKTHFLRWVSVLLTITFIVLKLCKVIAWTWLWVLSPFLIYVAGVIGISILGLIIVLIAYASVGKVMKKKSYFDMFR